MDRPGAVRHQDDGRDRAGGVSGGWDGRAEDEGRGALQQRCRVVRDADRHEWWRDRRLRVDAAVRAGGVSLRAMVGGLVSWRRTWWWRLRRPANLLGQDGAG